MGGDPRIAARDDEVGNPALYEMRERLAEVTRAEREGTF